MELVTGIIINIIEYIMIYFIYHNLINSEKKLSFKIWFLGILYGTLIGLFFYYINSYVARVISNLTLILTLKLISRKKIHDIWLIYILIFILLGFIQVLPLLFISKLEIVKQHLNFLLIQIITLIIVVFLCFKIRIHYFYDLVQKEILLRLILYIAMFVFFIQLFFANYSYTIVNIVNFLIIISLTIASISIEIVRIFSSYRKQISENLHDTKNLIGGMHMIAHSTTDINQIRKNLNECIELLQLENSVLDTFEINQEKENILLFIQQKKEQESEELEIISKIKYIDGHEKVPLGIVVYMLGTLLDNAIEYVVQHQIKHKPILIELLIIDDTIEIHVSNPYEKEVTEEFKKSFEKGYSTKSSHQRGRNGRGYGLSNLKRVLKKYDGIIYYGGEYHSKYDCTYLTITIEISCYASWKAQELEKSTNYGNRTLYLVQGK